MYNTLNATEVFFSGRLQRRGYTDYLQKASTWYGPYLAHR